MCIRDSSEEGREMSFLAHMIASRKLYMAATDVSEFYEGPSTFVDVSVPTGLQRVFDTKIYVRLGTKTKPFTYREASAAQLANFREMIGQQNQMLNNLQEKVMPWTCLLYTSHLPIRYALIPYDEITYLN